MKGLRQSELKKAVEKKTVGKFVSFLDEEYYKMENYDQMTDFFMTITSASDVWNTLWSKGGISAGRIDCNHALFPYYTADKIADAKTYTGSYTAILVEHQGETFVWEPFTKSAEENYEIRRNLYKNTTGSKVYFEEINKDLGIAFTYGWTSSKKFGLVKHSFISLLDEVNAITCKIKILDGCRNILPACVDANFQNTRSVLLDAYKKTDYDSISGLTLFCVSSVVTDKAEPSEGLYANTCWFTTEGKILIDPCQAEKFILGEETKEQANLCGHRASCFIEKTIDLTPGVKTEWYQVFDTWLDTAKVLKLKDAVVNKQKITKELLDDIQANQKALEELINQADGIQNTADKATCVHHKANVMFNIMRGGIFADNGIVNTKDFKVFIETRNKAFLPVVEKLLQGKGETLTPQELMQIVFASGNKDSLQLERLCLEYVPLVFSRRHGDPSRPWNFFSIKLQDQNGNRSYNYEGNWRDIFQNWEALCLSYPGYTKNIIAKFLNAMTIDGFNPYRISRDGVDWEIPDPTDPWSNIGYWNDHQVIYLQKLLELQYQISPESIYEYLNKKLFSTSNIPYRLKNYKEICENPRDTVVFEADLSKKLLELSKQLGTDAKLVKVGQAYSNPAAPVEQVSMLTKLLQIVLTKLANFVPAGGIWMNTQRPEWNDANNALAGYGLSMVTLNYLYRMMKFIIQIVQNSGTKDFSVPSETVEFLQKMAELYKIFDPQPMMDWESLTAAQMRKTFVDAQGLLFEEERKQLYEKGHSKTEKTVTVEELCTYFSYFFKHIELTFEKNKRSDGLFHTYNTLLLSSDGMKIAGLTLMLEGQVAALSSGYLDPASAAALCEQMKKSALYVADRNTYILYPDKVLPDFWEKNCFDGGVFAGCTAAQKMLQLHDSRIFMQGEDGVCHFNPDFKNVDFMRQAFANIDAENPGFLSNADKATFEQVYESVFNHISFTGRSGTFYAYEGLGSVYWHMVAKYLVAVQEYVLRAQASSDAETTKKLVSAYYDIRSGIGFNKTPEVYGAFPTDPYSHTPKGQGAKQPGMTGQVKEEIITRWGELGVFIENGQLVFAPSFLQEKEYLQGSLSFTRFGYKIFYTKGDKATVSVCYADGTTKVFEGNAIPNDVSQKLFERSPVVRSIVVNLA